MNAPRKAMILAAGLGTRMAPLTATRPKPLIELKGKALIDYAIDRFIAQGVNFIVVNVHYLADQLEAHLKKRKDVEIHICDETRCDPGHGRRHRESAAAVRRRAVLHAQLGFAVGRRHGLGAHPHAPALESGDAWIR